MKKTLIGLTGGIGSGKSTALNILKDLGFSVLSCDEITAELYKKQSVIRKLKRAFPNAVKGKIILSLDKSVLAKALENDEDYKLLTDITAPLIMNEALQKANKLKGAVIIETPLLFEQSLEYLFSKIIVITRDKEARINAVICRSNLTKEQVLTRMSRQIDYDAFDLSPYIVIENNGNIEELKTSITKATEDLIN